MNNIIYRETGKDQYYRIWHKASRNMFIFIESGSGSIVTKDKSYPMGRGTLCFIGEGKYHYTFPEQTECYVRSKLFVTSEAMGGIIRLLGDLPEITDSFGGEKVLIGTLSPSDIKRAEQIFDDLQRYSDGSDIYPLHLYSAAIRLMALLTENQHAPKLNPLGAVQNAVEYIHSHITENITVEEVSASVYMSKYHFCRIFKEKMHVTVMEYVLKTRIMMAMEMLSDGKQSVTGVSEACAFSSVAYFSRVFKKETGVTPLQYKKAALGRKPNA